MTVQLAASYPQISVSVVTFKTCPNELKSILHGLRDSCVEPIVTVVDNSPTRDLEPVVRRAGAAYIYPGRNTGYGGGHNLAIQSVWNRSTYHLVCNPDIQCGAEILPSLTDFMERFPEVGLVMPRVIYSDETEQWLCKRLPSPMDLFLRRFVGGSMEGKLLRQQREMYELKGVDRSQTQEIPNLSGCFMFLRTDVLRRVGLFDERFFMYLEDIDLCRRIGAVSRTVFYPEVSVVHGFSRGSYKNVRLLGYHMASAVQYFNKWGWWSDTQRRDLNERAGLVLEDVPAYVTQAR